MKNLFLFTLVALLLPMGITGCSVINSKETDNRKRLKIFLLSGQSNMTGRGNLGDLNKPAEDQQATLVRYIMGPQQIEKYKFLYAGPKKTKSGWTVRDDVFITTGDWPHVPTDPDGYGDSRKHGGLGPYYGGRRNKGIGPELAIGHLLGNYFDQPVLLVKVSFGGNSLAKEFRPPSSSGEVGNKYHMVLKAVREAIEHLPEIIPGYTEKQGYELAGFFWNQGLNDLSYERSGQYQINLVNLINDLRKDLNVPEMKSVVAVTGNWGPGSKQYRAHLEDYAKNKKIPIDQFMKDRGGEFLESLSAIRKAQRAVSILPEFKDTVATAETCDFWRPREAFGGHGTWQHWNANGESYWLIGEAMGREMIKLLKTDSKK